MWWWQSVALGGAFSLGGSVPVEYFTCWASAGIEEARTPAAAISEATLTTSRRVHGVISIRSSLKLEYGRPRGEALKITRLALPRIRLTTWVNFLVSACALAIVRDQDCRIEGFR